MSRGKSRTQRWADACAAAQSAIQDLVDLQQEYQEWLDNLPEGLDESPVADKLSEVCDLDIEGAQGMVAEFEGVDLPLGFGRD